jgi:hypothetical protein
MRWRASLRRSIPLRRWCPSRLALPEVLPQGFGEARLALFCRLGITHSLFPLFPSSRCQQPRQGGRDYAPTLADDYFFAVLAAFLAASMPFSTASRALA